MAEKVIIDLELDSSQAQKSVENFSDEFQKSGKKQRKSIDDLQDELSKLEAARNKANNPKEIRRYNKEIRRTEKRLKKTASAQKLVTKAQKGLNIGVKGLGAALKGVGIGLVIAAFAELVELLKSNQKVVDAFTVAFGTVKGVFNEVVEVAQPLIDAFKALFEREFGKAADAFEEFGENVANMNLGKIAKDSYEGAQEVTNLSNEIKILEAETEGAIQKFELRREKLRQIRDDDRKSNQERIEASKELQEVIEKQSAAEEKLAQKRLEVARKELEIDEDNVSKQRAVIEAENEMVAIQNRLATETSERLLSERALRNEIQAEIDAQIKKEKDLEERTRKTRIRLLEDEKKKVEAEFQIEIEAIRKKYGKGTELEKLLTKEKNDKLDKIEEERKEKERQERLKEYELDKNFDQLTFEEKRNRLKKQADLIAQDEILTEKQKQKKLEQISEQLKKLKEEEARVEGDLNRKKAQMAINAAQQAFNAAAMLAGEGTAMQKALSIGGIIADSAQAVLGTWAGYSSMGPFGTAQAVAQTAMIAATAAKNIQQVTSIQPPPQAKAAGGGGGASSAGSANISAPQVPAPEFNMVGDTGNNQLAQTINMQADQPTKAYVVSSEVSSAQQLDRMTEQNATF